MRHTDNRAVFLQSIDNGLDVSFRARIQGSCRFIENNDRSVTNKGTGDGNSLALATGQTHPAFTDLRIVTIRQPHDKIVATGGPGSQLDFRPGRSRLRASDIPGD